MSHAEERKEKDCLNCGTIVEGRYCQKCGQENIVPHETFGHMIKHFFYDITHFDSKFLDSVKYLIAKPGYLSRQYMLGKRTTFLNPVKMYVFTSAVFFLILFSVYGTSLIKVNADVKDKSIPSRKEIKKVEGFGLSNSRNKKDSVQVAEAFAIIHPRFDSMLIANNDGEGKITLGGTKKNYTSIHEYDSTQRSLSKSERDGWFRRILTRKTIDFNTRYEGNEAGLIKDIMSKFTHTFPYMLFVSLPLYALFLKLLYVRNKKYFFVDHGIFLIHLYIFTFILMLIFFSIEKIAEATGVSDLEWLQAIVVIYGIWYAYKAMKNFYGQSYGKTLIKFILFNILCFISLLILFGLFFIITILRA